MPLGNFAEQFNEIMTPFGPFLAYSNKAFKIQLKRKGRGRISGGIHVWQTMGISLQVLISSSHVTNHSDCQYGRPIELLDNEKDFERFRANFARLRRHAIPSA
jgi:hypothetical protein